MPESEDKVDIFSPDARLRTLGAPQGIIDEYHAARAGRCGSPFPQEVGVFCTEPAGHQPVGDFVTHHNRDRLISWLGEEVVDMHEATAGMLAALGIQPPWTAAKVRTILQCAEIARANDHRA